MTFEAMELSGRDNTVDASSFRKAKETAQTYSHDPMGWLVISGPSGTGKTHLAAAIVNRLITESKPAKFINVSDLLKQMRLEIDYENSDHVNENLLDHLSNAPMLILDDLGTHSRTHWAEEQLDQLFGHRYDRRLPTVITTSEKIEDLPERLQTRLSDPFIAEQIHLKRGVGNPDSSTIGLDSITMDKMTFRSFDPNGASDGTKRQRETLNHAITLAKHFADGPQGWLYLAGETGVGKTHLAVAIANVQVQHGRSVLFRFVPDLLDQLRRAYRPNTGNAFDHEFQVIRDCEVLILDDFGAQATTPWAEEKIYQLIVHRHTANLPTVITSRILLEEPKTQNFTSRYSEAISSRLRDAHVVSEVLIHAPDFRHRGSTKSRQISNQKNRGNPRIEK